MPRIVDQRVISGAAVAVFSRRGYGAATTQEIAAAAGVNEVTLFRRHGNKAALITSSLAHCLGQSPFAQLKGSDDLRADLEAIVKAYVETYQAYGGAVMTLLTDAARYPELRPSLAVLMPNLKRAARIIARHQRAGRLQRGDPLQKVLFLLAPILASGLWGRAGARLPAARLQPARVVEAFLEGHRARR